MITDLAEFESKICEETPKAKKPYGGFRGSLGSSDTDTAKHCLNYLSSSMADDYQQWLEVGMALHSSGCTWQDWDNWSRSSDKYEPEVCEQKWKSFNNTGKCLTVASLVDWAKNDDPTFIVSKNNRKRPQVNSDPNTWGKIIPFSEFNLPAFPIEVLPTDLADYLNQLAESLQIPVDMPAMLALAACSYCVSGCRISPKPDWIEPLNIFTAIIMPPASKKSAAMKLLTEPLKIHEKEQMENISQEVIKNHSARRVLENKQKKLEMQLSKGEDVNTRIELNEINRELAEFQDIFLPTIIASDSTPEAVARLLFENDGRLSLFNAEGGIFGTMAGRYNSGTPNLDVFLQGHAGDSLKVNRIGRPSEYVENPCLTIGLAIQPTILENLKHKTFMQECGLLARFLFVTPDSDHGQNKYATKPIGETAKAYYQSLIFGLLKSNSITLRLDPEAEKIFARYFEAFEPRLNGDLYQVQAWAGKLRGAVLRIAGILELVENPNSQTVSEKTIKAAITIGEYLTKHAKTVFNLMDFDKELHLANRILSWISRKSKNEFSLSEVYTAVKTSAANRMDDFRGALDRLIEHNYLRHSTEKTQGRPSNRYEVNPDFQNQT